MKAGVNAGRQAGSGMAMAGSARPARTMPEPALQAVPTASRSSEHNQQYH